MGTTFRVVLYAADKATAKKAADAAFARVAELDDIMSDYKQNSELMRLCKKFATEVGEPVKVSDDLFFVLQKAEELSKKSDGAFDVTVGPVVQLWRHARRTQELPDPKEFAAARAKVGYKKVKLDAAKKTVQLTTPGMQLDLGGIAKGYAADEALKLLREKFGITRALVAASGDITCGDPPPGKDAWTVDIAPIAKSQKPRTLAPGERGGLDVRRPGAVRGDQRRAVFARPRPEDRPGPDRPAQRDRDRAERHHRRQHDEGGERAAAGAGAEVGGGHARRGGVHRDPGQGREAHRTAVEAVRAFHEPRARKK